MSDDTVEFTELLRSLSQHPLTKQMLNSTSAQGFQQPIASSSRISSFLPTISSEGTPPLAAANSSYSSATSSQGTPPLAAAVSSFLPATRPIASSSRVSSFLPTISSEGTPPLAAAVSSFPPATSSKGTPLLAAAKGFLPSAVLTQPPNNALGQLRNLSFFENVKSKKKPSVRLVPFSRRLILIQNTQKIPTVREEQELVSAGRIVNDVQFFTNMTDLNVKEKITSALPCLSKNNDLGSLELQFFICRGSNYLQPLVLEPGKTVTGAVLLNNSTKTAYVFSSDKGLNEGLCKDDPDSDDSSDWFVPKRSREDKQRGTELSTNNAELNITPTEGGNYVYTDEFGQKFVLEQVVPSTDLSVHQPSTSKGGSESASAIINRIKSNGKSQMYFTTISREILFFDFLKVLKDPKFSMLCNLKVTFEGEEGVGVGVKKDLLTSLILAIKDENQLFEGDFNSKSLIYSKKSLEDKLYEAAGKIIQLNILNEGPGPQFFSKIFYHVLCYGTTKGLALKSDDICNDHVKHEIQQLETAANNVECNQAIIKSDIYRWAGTSNYVSSYNFEEERSKIVRDAVEYYCFDRIKDPIEQLRSGLNAETKLFDKIKEAPHLFEKFFILTEDSRLTASLMEQAFSIPAAQKKSDTYKYWCRFLKDCEDGNALVTLNDVLHFATGFDKAGVADLRGMGITLSIEAGYLPRSSVCANRLILPMHSDYDTFKMNLELGFSSKPFSTL